MYYALDRESTKTGRSWVWLPIRHLALFVRMEKLGEWNCYRVWDPCGVVVHVSGTGMEVRGRWGEAGGGGGILGSAGDRWRDAHAWGWACAATSTARARTAFITDVTRPTRLQIISTAGLPNSSLVTWETHNYSCSTKYDTLLAGNTCYIRYYRRLVTKLKW